MLAVLLMALLALPCILRPAVVEVVRVATMTFSRSTSTISDESGPGDSGSREARTGPANGRPRC